MGRGCGRLGKEKERTVLIGVWRSQLLLLLIARWCSKVAPKALHDSSCGSLACNDFTVLAAALRGLAAAVKIACRERMWKRRSCHAYYAVLSVYCLLASFVRRIA